MLDKNVILYPAISQSAPEIHRVIRVTHLHLECVPAHSLFDIFAWLLRKHENRVRLLATRIAQLVIPFAEAFGTESNSVRAPFTATTDLPSSRYSASPRAAAIYRLTLAALTVADASNRVRVVRSFICSRRSCVVVVVDEGTGGNDVVGNGGE